MTAGRLPGEVRVLSDPVALAEAAAEWVAACSRGREAFRVAASGGSSPRRLYQALASPALSGRIDWARWHVFFGDERAVPPDDPQSNYHLVAETLLSKVSVPPEHVHRMEGDRADLDAAAAAYSAVLEKECGSPPRLDLVLLGLGGDGHTASLFPGTTALEVDDAWATRGRAPEPPIDRLTLTLAAINAAERAAFLVTGAGKGDALQAVINGSAPAARVRPAGELVWFLDAAAAGSVG